MKHRHRLLRYGPAPRRQVVPVLGIASACLLAGVSAQGWAQTVPTPGDLQRQVEPVRPSPLPELSRQPRRLTQPSLPQPGATVARIREWTLVGNTVLTSERLLPLLQPFTGVALSLVQIREAAAVIQQAYEEAGWLARVDIPAQDITEGRVTLQITESRLGRVQLDSQSTSRVHLERLRSVLEAQQAPGTPLNLEAVNRGLLLADDLNGVGVVGTLAPGGDPSTTDVVLRAHAESPLLIDLSLDNTGARSVGAEKLTATLNWVSPAGFGETYTAQASKTQGSDYLRLAAGAPLGYDGWRYSIYITRMDYKIITPDAEGRSQDINGNTLTAGLDLTYPLLRRREANLLLVMGLDERRFEGFANGALNSKYAVPGAQLSVTGNFFDTWGGSASNTYALTWRSGEVGRIQPQENLNTQGRFHKVTWNYSRQQSLGPDFTFFTSVSGQNTGNKELDSSENMSLGGPSGVRAYPVGEASGPQARIANLELRWRVHPQWLITPFYDEARVEKRVSGGPAAYALRGSGLSVAWSGRSGVAVRAIYARRLGNNPNANTTTGMDGDGSRRLNRFWLTASASF